jgi:hypothetical protein
MVKKGLFCGLNYPNQQYPLHGCVNDCLDWEEKLRMAFGFEETRVLMDQNPDGSICTAPTQIPTRANVLAQLGWLCTGVQQGDVLVFFFAGHGCNWRSSNGQMDEALVPEDYAKEGQGMPLLVFADEVHALFARLPAGSFLTVILDCCHGSHMLDVPTSLDSAARPARQLTTMEPVREIINRSGEAWQKAMMQHAQARPRFVPTVMGGPRKKRTPEGAGAHLGRQTLDPGVTAFSFAASRSPECAYDANIKNHQRGVMSFCLLEALKTLDDKCTYQMLFENAAAKMDDIRTKYMPDMDQHIQLSYCPNSTPDLVVCFDEQYATVSQYTLTNKRPLQSERSISGDRPYNMYPDNAQAPGRVPSTDFVPSPVHNHQPPQQRGPPPGAASGPPAAGAGAGGSHHHHHAHGPIIYLIVHQGLGLRLPMGDTNSELFTVAKMGNEERRTPPTSAGPNPVWSADNQFTFHVNERDSALHLEVHSAKYPQSECIARASVDLRSLQPREWLRRRERLQGTDGELEFDVRLEPGTQQQPPTPQGAPQPQPQQQPAQHMPHAEGSRTPIPDDRRPPSPVGPSVTGTADFGAFGGHSDGFGAASSTPMMDIPAGGIFGMPNLFGAMPNLLSQLSGTGPGAGGFTTMPPPGVPPGCQVPTMGAVGMQAGFGSTLGSSPGRGLSGSMPMSYASPQATMATPWSPGPTLPSQLSTMSPQPHMPTASMGIDLNQNGRADLVVQGPDFNYNGIPDALEPALRGGEQMAYVGEPIVYGSSAPMYRTAVSGGSYMLPPVNRVVTAGVGQAIASPMMVAGGQRSTAVLNARN